MKKLLAGVLAIVAIVAIAFALPTSASAAGGATTTAAKHHKGKKHHKKGHHKKGHKGHKGKGKKKNKKTFVVCKHGCKYKTISKAVKKVKKKNSTIKVKPGKYVEGVIVEGHKYDGLTIKGKSKNPKKVILEGKNAKVPGGAAQNGIEGIDVKNLTLKNMWARHYPGNGFFVKSSNPYSYPTPTPASKIDCSDYLMKNLVASFNASYGLYAFGCSGGRITKSVGYGHGDSAIYIGGTPVQKKPDWTSIDHDKAYENVLGYSGTNSRYVDIKQSDWYNNGAGIVPNTLDSEPFEPASDSRIHNNNIFWNNFNYYLPDSPVKTVSGGLGTVDLGGGNKVTLNYPTGIGVILFGATNWKVDHNNIFGNFKYGSAAFSDPFNCEGPPSDNCPTGDDAMSQDNKFKKNSNGRDGTDTNAVDFWADGSGKGNCFQGNDSSTFDPGGVPNSNLYPTCPAPAPPASGTGTANGDLTQVLELVSYSGSNPPETMACSWDEHSHPAFKHYKPIDATQGDPNCSG